MAKTKTVRVGKSLRISEKQHEALLEFIRDRLDFGKEMRDQQVSVYRTLDTEMAGTIKRSPEDEARKRDTDAGEGIKPYDIGLPLTDKQIDDAVTNLMSILVDEAGLYSVIASADQQAVGNSLAAVMNRHADLFQHIRELNIALNHMLRYNFGGNIIEWHEIYGTRLKNSVSGIGYETEETIIRSGNTMPHIDPYNFLYDWTVHPVKLPYDGEFFASVDAEMPFRLKRAQRKGELFGNIDAYLRQNNFSTKYFKKRPIIQDKKAIGLTDWHSILSMQPGGTLGNALERVVLYTWIEPKRYGLSGDDNFEIWKFVILNDERIVKAERQDNAHGLLPCVLGMPKEDGFDVDTHGYGQTLLPFQRFASYQMNAHQRAVRKKTYGITYYDERIFPELNERDDDFYAGRLGFSPPADIDNFDIRKHLHKDYDAPDTDRTLADIQSMMELMNHILPTDQLRQVADLERATRYQSAATVQGSHRGNWKLAKLIDVQHMTPARFMQYYNVMQYQRKVDLLSDNGERIEVDPAEYRDTDIEFALAEGLKAIDKLSVIENFKEVIRWSLQSQEAMQEFSLAEMIDYWTSLQGDKTDFTQFRRQSALDGLSPEQKEEAAAVYQQYLQQQEGQQGNQ